MVRIDARTYKVVATIKTKASPCGGITLEEHAVWVSTCFDDTKAIRIDPKTNTVVAEVEIGGRNGGAVVIDGYPWFPVDNHLVRVDPATNRLDRVVEFDEWFESFGAVVAFDSIWIGSVAGEIAVVPLAVLDN